MSIADKLTAIAENEQKVYDAGKTAEWNDFWDVFQNKGARTDYGYAFMTVNAWNSTTFRPKYDIKPSTCFYMFYNATGMTDFIGGLEYNNIVFDTSKATSFYYAFCNTKCTRLPHIDMSNAASYEAVFSYSTKLETIDKLTMPVREKQSATYNNGLFTATATIKNITIGGVIAHQFNMSTCKNLTHDSLMSIINALVDYAVEGDTNTHILSIGFENLEKLTEDELKMITDKGWTYA